MQSRWKGGDGSRPSCSSQVAQVISYAVWVLQHIPGVSRATRAPHSSTARPQLMGRRKPGCVTAGGLPRPQKTDCKGRRPGARCPTCRSSSHRTGTIPEDFSLGICSQPHPGTKARKENPNPGNRRIHFNRSPHLRLLVRSQPATYQIPPITRFRGNTLPRPKAYQGASYQAPAYPQDCFPCLVHSKCVGPWRAGDTLRGSLWGIPSPVTSKGLLFISYTEALVAGGIFFFTLPHVF